MSLHSAAPTSLMFLFEEYNRLHRYINRSNQT